MIRSVTVVNHIGDHLELPLANPKETGMAITGIDGLGPGNADILLSDFASGDGAVFNSSRLLSRNIVLHLKLIDAPTIEDTRLRVYKYFPIKKPIWLLIETDRRRVQIQGYVESNEPDIFSDWETETISIMCPDPYFQSVDDQITDFSGVTPEFEFDFYNGICTTAGTNPDKVVNLVKRKYSELSATFEPSQASSAHGYSGGNISPSPINGSRGKVTFTNNDHSITANWLDTVGNVFGAKVDIASNKLYVTHNAVKLTNSNLEIVKVNDKGFLELKYVGSAIPKAAKGSLVLGNVSKLYCTAATAWWDDYNNIDFDSEDPNQWAGGVMIYDVEDQNLSRFYYYDENRDSSDYFNDSAHPDWPREERIEEYMNTFSDSDTPLLLVYELETPIVYNLDDMGVDASIYGSSGWTSDAGEVTVGAIETVGSFYRQVEGAYFAVKFEYDNVADPSLLTLQINNWERKPITNLYGEPITAQMLSGYYWLFYYDGENYIFLAPNKGTDIGKVFSYDSVHMGSVYLNQEKTVYYLGENDTGMEIDIKFIGNVGKITIYNTVTLERMIIDTNRIIEKYGLGELQPGDRLTITTSKGNKRAIFTRGMNRYNVINAFDKRIDWFQLRAGDNIFAYTVTDGITNLEMFFSNKILYEGV